MRISGIAAFIAGCTSTVEPNDTGTRPDPEPDGPIIVQDGTPLQPFIETFPASTADFVQFPDHRIASFSAAGVTIDGPAPGETSVWPGVASLVAGTVLPDGTALISDGASLWVPRDGELVESPLGALIPGVTRMERSGTDVWLRTADRLVWLHDTAIADVAVDGYPIQNVTVGGRLSGKRAVWLDAGPAFALIPADSGWVVGDSLWDISALSTAADGEGFAWFATEDGLLNQRTLNGELQAYQFPAPVTEVWASPSASDVWVVAGKLWHGTNGAFSPVDGAAPAVVGVDEAGRLLVRAESPERWSTTRVVAVVGIANGAAVNEAAILRFVPSLPADLTSLTVSVDDGAAVTLTSPWEYRLDPGTLEDGYHHIAATATWGSATAESEIEFSFGVPIPAWEHDIQPIFLAHCEQCHGGSSAQTILETYDDWKERYDDILLNVQPRRGEDTPRMPAVGEPLTDDEVRTIAAWAEGGFLP